jgi:hypothetical protein
MAQRKRRRVAGNNGRQEDFSLRHANISINNQIATPRQESIRAELTGATVCAGAGITVQSAAPVLAWCRQALTAGVDPATSLHVYRGDTLSLTVRTIGEGAALEINGAGTGFRRRYGLGPASPVRFDGPIGAGSSLIGSSLSGAAPP